MRLAYPAWRKHVAARRFVGEGGPVALQLHQYYSASNSAGTDGKGLAPGSSAT